ncbi:hypothetical protein T492DRAFT_849122 [Pavlovales sp. CCMP2436]|nr:hypothetical protein T492DRAFT_849122 [Pavlovales sp. CCMP2436]
MKQRILAALPATCRPPIADPSERAPPMTYAVGPPLHSSTPSKNEKSKLAHLQNCQLQPAQPNSNLAAAHFLAGNSTPAHPSAGRASRSRGGGAGGADPADALHAHVGVGGVLNSGAGAARSGTPELPADLKTGAGGLVSPLNWPLQNLSSGKRKRARRMDPCLLPQPGSSSHARRRSREENAANLRSGAPKKRRFREGNRKIPLSKAGAFAY